MGYNDNNILKIQHTFSNSSENKKKKKKKKKIGM